MYLVINNCVTAVILSNFSRHYLRNRSTSDIGFLVKSVYFNLRKNLPKSGTFPVCLKIKRLQFRTQCICVFCLMIVMNNDIFRIQN